jgi:integrase
LNQLSNPQNQPITNQPSALPLLTKLQREAFSIYTIDATAKHLKRLAEHCDLNKPQQVLDYVSALKVSNGYKINLYKAYRHLAKFYNIPFTMPENLRAESQHVTIPTLEKLNAFINYSRRGLALKLRISKYGLRPIEVVTLKAKDIDPDHKTITPTTAKKGLPRTIPIDQPLAETLRAEIQKRKLQPNDYLFIPIAKNYCKTFIAMRTRLAKQMNDPTIKQVKLYHFRHYFGTMTQLKYRDVPTTAHLLGHRDWKNTQIYVDLAKILEMGEDGENYIVKTATNVKEDAELIQLGFTYITERDNVKIYRKRK